MKKPDILVLDDFGLEGLADINLKMRPSGWMFQELPATSYKNKWAELIRIGIIPLYYLFLKPALDRIGG